MPIIFRFDGLISCHSIIRQHITMDEHLRNGLLSIATGSYSIGYLHLSPKLEILSGNNLIDRWLEKPLSAYIGESAMDAFPELVGSEDAIQALSVGEVPFRLAEIYRSSHDEVGEYFDLQIARLDGGGGALLLMTFDVTLKAHQEQTLQQQRNELRILSAELAHTNERLTYVLERLVPASVARSIISERTHPHPGGQVTREATILFADMRDFTTYAETYQPADTLEFLNTYLAVISEVILGYEGNLVQIVGDMVMGVFNIPLEQPDHAVRGINAAIDIQKALSAFNAKADSRFPSVSFGIGISTGAVISGYLGYQRRFRYAVVGDATNIAYHLCSMAAAGKILLSESTVMATGNRFIFHEKGEMQLKRRRNLVKVYEMGEFS